MKLDKISGRPMLFDDDAAQIANYIRDYFFDTDHPVIFTLYPGPSDNQVIMRIVSAIDQTARLVGGNTFQDVNGNNIGSEVILTGGALTVLRFRVDNFGYLIFESRISIIELGGLAGNYIELQNAKIEFDITELAKLNVIYQSNLKNNVTDNYNAFSHQRLAKMHYNRVLKELGIGNLNNITLNFEKIKNL